MPAQRFGRMQKATALLPLAVLSAAWTVSVAGFGLSSASAGEDSGATLPDGTTVPTDAIEAPASVSSTRTVAPGLKGDPDKIAANASTSGIPSAALAAYQRAETVINAADKACNLPWELVAAIGRVESNHGRANGNTLNTEGLAKPGIYGIALDGSQGTAVIRDTDAGQYDSDAKYDRAVGPMQFIPSTWSVVGVDADGDAQRNPQDIDDAALATAVYLCSGKDDLSTTAGQREAVFRYNHSESYVDLVLSIMQSYLSGDFTSVPNTTTTSSTGTFEPTPSTHTPGGHGNNGHGNGGGNGGGNNSGGGGGDTGGGGGGSVPTDNPTTPPSTGGGDGGGDNGGGLDLPDLPLPGGGGGDGGGGGGGSDPIEDVLTPAAATAQCLADLGVDSVANLNPLQLLKFNDCMDKLGF